MVGFSLSIWPISPNSSWAEWGSQFLLETVFVPSWFSGPSWFRLWFRGLSPSLSPFLSLLSLLKKGICSIMVLVPPGSGSGSGACLPSAFFLLFSGMISWFILAPAGVPVLVSLLLSSFFSSEKGSVPSWCPGSFWFRLGFRCLFPFFSPFSFLRNGVLFHHDFLVPGGSGSGAGACLTSFSPNS